MKENETRPHFHFQFENPAKAPWYLLGLQELVSYSAFPGGVAIPMLAGVGRASLHPLLTCPASEVEWVE